MHEDNGVKFYFERGIKEFVGSDGKVTEAVLSDDTRLPADVCVMGVGKGINNRHVYAFFICVSKGRFIKRNFNQVLHQCSNFDSVNYCTMSNLLEV